MCWLSGVIGFFLLPVNPHALSPPNELVAAERLYQAGKYAEAEKLYTQISAEDPNYPLAQLRLGTICYLGGRAAQAEQHFRVYLQFCESAEVYSLLAGAQFNQKKFSEAHASVKKALTIDPAYPKTYTVLGMILTATGEWPAAEAAYREALRLDKTDADTWYMLGRGYFLRNEFVKAKEAFEAALKLSPQRMRTYENLALTLEVMGEEAAAERTLQEGLRVNRAQTNRDPRIHLAYGTFLLKRRRLAESLTELHKAARLAPQDAEPHYELARVLFSLKRWPEAAREAEAALRLGGSNYRAHYLLSRIYRAWGKTAEAERHAQLAAHLADREQLRGD